MNGTVGTAWNPSHPVTVELLLEIAEEIRTAPLSGSSRDGMNVWQITPQIAIADVITRACNRRLGRPQ